MKPAVFFLTLFLYCLSLCGQQVFFKSAQEFGEKQLQPYYSSITQQGNLLLFNANDYHVYAYDKNNGNLLWKYYLRWKSNVPPFFIDSVIWAQKGENEIIQLAARTGQEKGTLALHTVETKPLVKGNIVYATGIYDGGCLFAYDRKADTVVWSRFLAHGCSVPPFYLGNRIVANGEGYNWLEVGYDGKLVQKDCDAEKGTFPSELPCTRRFISLTHDGKEIVEDFIQKELASDPDELSFYTTAQTTFIASSNQVLVLGDKLRKKTTISLADLSDSFSLEEKIRILQADEKKVWMQSGDHLVLYDLQQKRLSRIVDLTPWYPHQVLIDDNKLWLISRKDGLLYGLTL